MNYKTRKAISILLGFVSAAGTVATAILAAKETPEAIEKIKDLKNKQDSKKIDYIKELIPIYWPAAVVCFSTIASTTISNIISIKTEASLIATSTMLNQGWRKYKNKVKDIFGIDASKLIDSEIAKDDYKESKPKKIMSGDEELYWEEHLGFFKCRPLDLMAAITDLNQRLHTPDPDLDGTFYFTTLSVLMKDAEASVYDKDKLKACKNIGWTTDYLCEVYDIKCMWVHANYTLVLNKETGEVLFTKISFFEEPIYLEDCEISRFNYKSREAFEHEAEIDIHDYDMSNMYSHGYQDIYDDSDEGYESKIADIQESFINTKIDCDCVEDDGRRFIPSNPSYAPAIKCLNGEDYNHPELKGMFDSNLPDEKDIPKL